MPAPAALSPGGEWEEEEPCREEEDGTGSGACLLGAAPLETPVRFLWIHIQFDLQVILFNFVHQYMGVSDQFTAFLLPNEIFKNIYWT